MNNEIIEYDMSKRLRQAMEKRNVKQVDLVAMTKIPQGALSHYITGRVKPKSDRIHLICKALNIQEAWLLGFDVEMDKPSAESLEKIKTYSSKLHSLSEADREIIYNMIDALLKKGE